VTAPADFRASDPSLLAELNENESTTESELQRLRRKVAADHAAMMRLHELSSHLTRTAGLTSFLMELLDATMALHCADFGAIQLYDELAGLLSTVAQRGFDPAFLERFGTMGASEPFACIQALHSRRRVIIEDVPQASTCAATQAAAHVAGYKAMQATPLFNRAGVPLGLLSTYFRRPHRPSEHELKLTDLYARQAAEFIGFKRSESALRESEARLAAIFNQAAAGLSEISLEGRFLRVNEELCRMLGRSRQELLSARILDVTHPEDAARSLATIARVVEGGKPASLDKRYLRADGAIVWANSILTRLDDESGRPRTLLAVTIDLTARKKAERALLESESRFRTLAEASPAMIWFLDAEGCHRFANRRFLEFFGKSERQIFGQDWRQLLHPDDADAFIADIVECVREHRPFRRQARVRRHDAQWRWTESHALPHFGDDSRYLGHVGQSMDITDRLAATACLRENERQLAWNLSGMSRLQALSTRLVRTGDFHSLLAEILAASADLTGTDKGNIQLYHPAAESLQLVVHQGHDATFLERFSSDGCIATWKALREGRRVIVEDVRSEPALRGSPDLEFFLKVGIRAMQSSPLISRSGRVLGMLNNHFRVPHRPADAELRLLDLLARMAADFIERSQAEQSLRQSEEKLRRAIEIETVGIIFFTTSGAITEANSAFLRMSGYSQEDLDQGRVRWDQMTPPEWMPHSLKAVEEFKSVGRIIPYEKEYLRKDGSRWWGLFSATRLDEDEGVEFIIDITERKKADEELRRHRDDLETRVQERTAALDAVNGALRDEIIERHRAESSRQELLRQLSTAQEEERRRLSRELHDDIGQHLTALLLGLKSLESSAASPESSAFLRELQDIAEKVGKEVHDLALELRPTALDDLGLLRTLANHIEEWAVHSKVEVDFHSSGWAGERLPLPIETTIFRIAQEALTNILKHAQATRVSLIIERRPEQVTMIVEDNGSGFDIDAVRGQPGRRRLGLLGMEERAALMGGDVKIESSPGNGTSLFVRIPLPHSAAIQSYG
jgi:PAS domain S-box-containing protein